MAHRRQFEVRRYDSEDRDRLRMLHNTVMSAANANYGPGPWNADLDTIPETYLNGRGEFLVGELDGEIVAMGGIHELDQTRCTIRRMRILPSVQRHGYGQQILDGLENAARDSGYLEIEIDTLRRLTGAQAFYEKNGYEHYATADFQGEPQLLYHKKLG